jgi:hypothetical protein
MAGHGELAGEGKEGEGEEEAGGRILGQHGEGEAAGGHQGDSSLCSWVLLFCVLSVSC